MVPHDEQDHPAAHALPPGPGLTAVSVVLLGGLDSATLTITAAAIAKAKTTVRTTRRRALFLARTGALGIMSATMR